MCQFVFQKVHRVDGIRAEDRESVKIGTYAFADYAKVSIKTPLMTLIGLIMSCLLVLQGTIMFCAHIQNSIKHQK